MIGALIMAFLRNGCQQMGWPNYIQEIIIGVIIVLAVALDRVRARGRVRDRRDPVVIQMLGLAERLSTRSTSRSRCANSQPTARRQRNGSACTAPRQPST